MDNKQDVAIIVLNLVQFQSIQPALDEMERHHMLFELIVPDYGTIKGADPGIFTLFNDTYEYLINNQYKVIRKPRAKARYMISLSPYPTDWVMNVEAEFKIRYLYSFVTKPDVAFDVMTNVSYDAILCYSQYDASFLNAYAKTYIVGHIKFAKYTKKPKLHHSKKTILYLPTYGDLATTNAVCSKLQEFKKQYNFIIKAHHMTSFQKNEEKDFKKLQLLGKVYDHKTSLLHLLNKADMVLSDDSGAIWDAIIADVPVAVFNQAKKIYFDNILALQYELVEKDIIPGTSDINLLEKSIKKALSRKYFLKQQKLKQELFPISGQKSLDQFIEVINSIINGTFDYHYKTSHDRLTKLCHETKLLKSPSKDELTRKLQTSIVRVAELEESNRKMASRISELDLSIRKLLDTKTFKYAKKIKRVINKIGINRFKP